jgi:hypothetical protein
MNGIGWNLGKQLGVATGKPFGRLIAWDPVHQKPAWTQDYAFRGTAGPSRRREASSSRARRTGDWSPMTRRAAKSGGTLRLAAAWSRPR